MDFDLLVIGASAAGWQVAIAAARLDRKVGLIALRCLPASLASDLRSVPGCLIRDVCADWPIVRNSRRPADIRSQAASWRQFADYTLRIWQQEQDTYRDQLQAAGGKFWCGEASLSGAENSAWLKRPRSRRLELQFEHLLIATGSIAQSPKFATEFAPPAQNAAMILETAELGGSACVVGASLTGLRAACLLALWGNRVRLVDGRNVAETHTQEDSIDWYAWSHELGVRFETGEDVIGLKAESPRKMAVILESGRHIPADKIWLATGRQGRTAELNIESAGLTSDDCGRLWCDPDHRTWVPSILALGEVVGFPADSGCQPEKAAEIANNLFHAVPKRPLVGV